MTDRETRLRERIDELTDQRDAALDALWKARAGRKTLTQRLYEMRCGRDLWRHRALNKTSKHTTSARLDSLDGDTGAGAGRTT